MVGASGAISGVMGAYIVLYPRVKVHMLVFLGIFITRIGFRRIHAGLLVPASAHRRPGHGARDGGVAFWAHAGGSSPAWC